MAGAAGKLRAIMVDELAELDPCRELTAAGAIRLLELLALSRWTLTVAAPLDAIEKERAWQVLARHRGAGDIRLGEGPTLEIAIGRVALETFRPEEL